MPRTLSLPDRSAPANVVSYEQAREAARPEVPARFNAVIDIVERWAAEAPDDMALVTIAGDGSLMAEQTTADLARESRRMARALMAQGVTAGDRVFIMLPRVPEWYTAMLGAIRIGAIPMPAPNMLTPRDIGQRISRGGAVAAIVSDDAAHKIDAVTQPLPTLRTRIVAAAHAGHTSDIPSTGHAQRVTISDIPTDSAGNPEPEQATEIWLPLDGLLDAAGDGPVPEDPTAADDPMLLYFTSGTESLPKMVLQAQSYALGHVETARFWQDLRRGDRHWTVSDTGWAKAAWGGLFGQWHERATVVQVNLGKPDADTILRIVTEHDITSFCAPPTLYRMLVQADLGAHDLSRLRHATGAGEPLNPEVIRQWQDGTEDGDVAAVDEVGTIGVRRRPQRPPGLFLEYDGDPGATEAAMHGDWYLTGDKARVDADGYFWFEGRNDDVITSAAYRIGPFEVESALVEHPSVMEAAVVGKDDAERTQIVTAFVILVAGATPSDELTHALQDAVRASTAPYKYPREIHYVSALPKTVSGKIRRTELRDWLREGIPADVTLDPT